MRSPKLFMDETRAPVLDPGRKRTKTGYLWAIARDDRPWAGPDPPAVVYLYAPGAAPSMPSGRWPGSAASSRWTPTPPTRRWPIPRAPAVR